MKRITPKTHPCNITYRGVWRIHPVCFPIMYPAIAYPGNAILVNIKLSIAVLRIKDPYHLWYALQYHVSGAFMTDTRSPKYNPGTYMELIVHTAIVSL